MEWIKFGEVKFHKTLFKFNYIIIIRIKNCEKISENCHIYKVKLFNIKIL